MSPRRTDNDGPRGAGRAPQPRAGIDQRRPSAARLDTAYEQWDQWWADSDRRQEWSEPEEAVARLISSLSPDGADRVLDLGSGVGRHALAFARGGFAVVAIDASRTGLEQLAARARAEGLGVDMTRGHFIAIPLSDGSVDHIVAWNVIYHGDGETVRTALAECRRVLRPKGSLLLTLLSKRHRAFGIGREVRPDTFADEHSDSDKRHPHHYVDEHGAISLLAGAGFRVMSIAEIEQPRTGSCHWRLTAQSEWDGR